MSRYEDAVRGEEYVMPSTHTEATGIRSRYIYIKSLLCTHYEQFKVDKKQLF